MRIHRRTLLGSALALPFIGSQGWAQSTGQSFPNRPLTIAIPFAAGGPTDMIARLLAEGMSRELGQPVAAENVTGAGGTIAAARVAQSRPDGHTLMIHHIGLAAAATLYRQLPFNIERGFAPLGVVSHTGMAIVARPDFPARDLPAYMAVLREQGDRLNLGHAGLGGSNQLCGMLMQHAAGRNATTIVFRGSAPAMTEMMAGRLDISCEQVTVAAPFARDGRIKAYAVTLPERVAGFDVPTAREIGLGEFKAYSWYGIYAPGGTPRPIVDRMAAAIELALSDPTISRRFDDMGTPAMRGWTPDRFSDFLKTEIDLWVPLVRASGARAD